MRHFQLIVDNSKVSQSQTEKQIGLVLDNRLSFEERLTAMGAKVSKTIAFLRKLQHLQSFYLPLS